MESLSILSTAQSLSPMEWTAIPRFVVLSGFNGVGKTQLLALLAEVTENQMLSGIVSLSPKPARAGYLGVHWSPEVMKVTLRLIELVDHVEAALDNYKRAGNDQIEWFLRQLAFNFGASGGMVELIMKQLEAAGLGRPGVRKREIYGAIDPYMFVSRAPDTPLVSLAEMFFCYRNFELYQAAPTDTPPWDHVNELLAALKMRFSVEAPDMPGHDYELRCLPTDGGPRLAPKDLSSGEQAALALVATIVTTIHLGRKHRVLPKAPELLLLDEPDAHLHPSLIKDYLAHLRVLVEQFGTQIIMVTHRPDTLALAPPESLYEMKRDDGVTSIERVASASELISRLAADTIAVLPSTRIVLVEDEDDRVFHQAMYDRSRELALVPQNPMLVFMPVNARGGGGRDAVATRLELMRGSGFASVFRGLVDGDGLTSDPPLGVRRTYRRALENYLADPIALYSAIVAEPDIDQRVRASKGGGFDLAHVHELRGLDEAKLQTVAEALLSVLEDKVAPALGVEPGRVPYRLHGDRGVVVLQYPAWLATCPPKELLGALNKHVDKAIANVYVHGPTRLGLVPDDLVEVYRELAGPEPHVAPAPDATTPTESPQ